jgi:hypothetical protein
MPPSRRACGDSAGGRVTLLTLFRSMAGPNAALDMLRPSAGPRRDVAGGMDGDGW